MALSCAELSSTLERHLDLRYQPVALTFVAEQPPDLPRLSSVEPSSCAIWRRGEVDVFYAAAEDHFNCPLGAMVMGFPLTAAKMAELQEEVGMMCGLNYVRESEVEHVPQVAQPSAGIVYGPLWRFPLDPHVVLLWLTPHQTMMMSECCGLINWSESPAGLLGRPGCAAIPVALAQGRPAQSLGCVGMRTNTGVSGDLLLMAVPRNMLENMPAELEMLSQVHSRMEAHYRERIDKLSS